MVYNSLLQTGLNDTLARYATAQSAHETDGWTSSIYKSNNNAFGMKFAGQVNALGEKNGYAYYKGVNDSVSDLVAWYSRHRNNIFSLPLYINTVADYVNFLKRNNYFEASEAEYLNDVNNFYTKLFPK